ncbi:hypothetical protein ACJX0J_041520, partial [Zea mays]
LLILKKNFEFMINCLIHHKVKNISLVLFNSIIEMHGLIELDLSNPTFEKLDRFLVNPDWDLMFHNATKKNWILPVRSKNNIDIWKEKKNKYSENKSEQIGHQKRLRIHSLLDNGLLVDNEDEINKKYLTAPFSLDEIHKVDFWDIIKKDLWNIENQFGFTVFSRKKID